jgi:hypothetical protein
MGELVASRTITLGGDEMKCEKGQNEHSASDRRLILAN